MPGTNTQSFGIRHLNCVAGIMVTASHNPKLDNGYKVFWDNSAQVCVFSFFLNLRLCPLRCYW